MSAPTDAADVRRLWAPYVPTDAAPWNLRRVVHLHRRAGFSATWNEIQRDLTDGPEASIGRLLSGKARAGVAAEFESTSEKLARSAAAAKDVRRLQAWWVYRMLAGPDPLGERLTLCWHNHFATSAQKVGAAVYRQNEIFRQYARAPFGELLGAVVHDPALLLWLDAEANRKGQANENLARELMELFTLGVGHYDESDVKEAARALTGWTVVDGRFQFDAELHDAGEKTIFGRTQNWNGDELLPVLREHPATASRLAGRLCELFMGERVTTTAAVAALASHLRARRLAIGEAVELILRSEVFFADSNIGNRVLGPVEYVIGTARALELVDPCPNPLIVAEYAANLGQDLFHPPNVGGWPGGRSWISTRTAIGRHNYAAALVEGQPVGRPAMAALEWTRRYLPAGDFDAIITFYAKLFTGEAPSRPWRERIFASLGAKPAVEERLLRKAIVVMLASPEFQLA